MKAPLIDPVVLAAELEDAVSDFNRLAALAAQYGMAVAAEVHDQEMAEGSARPVLMIQVALPSAR